MNERLNSIADSIDSRLSKKERRRLVSRHADILMSNMTKRQKIDKIMERERRSLGFISYFLFSFLIRMFLEALIDRLT